MNQQREMISKTPSFYNANSDTSKMSSERSDGGSKSATCSQQETTQGAHIFGSIDTYLGNTSQPPNNIEETITDQKPFQTTHHGNSHPNSSNQSTLKLTPQIFPPSDNHLQNSPSASLPWSTASCPLCNNTISLSLHQVRSPSVKIIESLQFAQTVSSQPSSILPKTHLERMSTRDDREGAGPGRGVGLTNKIKRGEAAHFAGLAGDMEPELPQQSAVVSLAITQTWLANTGYACMNTSSSSSSPVPTSSTNSLGEKVIDEREK